jgi:hypothetical protein
MKMEAAATLNLTMMKILWPQSEVQRSRSRHLKLPSRLLMLVAAPRRNP